MALTRMYFLLSLALSPAGFIACRALAREPDASAWWALFQWGFVLLALCDVGILYVTAGDAGEGEGDEAD